MKSMNSDGFIYIKSEYKLIRIDYDDILYVEGVKDYIKLYFTAGKKPVMSLMNMKRWRIIFQSHSFCVFTDRLS